MAGGRACWFPDAGGARETFRQMGDRLASMGYVALIPDIYYRAGEWAPFDVATVSCGCWCAVEIDGTSVVVATRKVRAADTEVVSESGVTLSKRASFVPARASGQTCRDDRISRFHASAPADNSTTAKYHVPVGNLLCSR
jgi:dienelactone hydrolase